MTRTERSVFPRAMLKDRSESRSGLDKSLRKNGAGPHNWGSLDDERELEYAAMDDEGIEAEEADDDSAKSVTSDGETYTTAGPCSFLMFEQSRTTRNLRPLWSPLKRTSRPRGNSGRMPSRAKVTLLSPRRHLNLTLPTVDLSAIARTSAAVSSSPPHTVAITSDANVSIFLHLFLRSSYSDPSQTAI